MTGGTFLLSNHDRVVPVRMHRQHVRRAELDADLAAFAPRRIDPNFTARSFSHCRYWGGFDGGRYFGHSILFKMGSEIHLGSKYGKIHLDYIEI